MSTAGPMKNSSAGTTRSPVAARDDHGALERDQRGGHVRRRHRDAARGAKQTMLAVLALRRVGVAGVATGAVAIHARAVVPAARVLAEIAAQRGRRCGSAGSRRARRRAPAGRTSPAPRSLNAISVSVVSAPISRPSAVSRMPLSAAMPVMSMTRLGPLGAVLEPVVAVLAAGQQPASCPTSFAEFDRAFQRSRAGRARMRHHVAGHRQLLIVC